MRQTDGKKKKKERPTLVRLVSTAGTGFFYVAKKTKKAKQKFGSDKLEVRKFDPCVRRHVLFTEGKIK
ncbi:Ribosomal protein L33 family protein [Perilla frutescens var. frutescens]|nr:Ribosomal protein L33 family protein [Perilla frutescens var. frutescens]